MIRSSHNIFFLVIFGAFLAVFTGCATSGVNPPISMDPSFAAVGIQEITVLPTVDHRINRDLGTELNKNVQRMLKRRLEKKRYNVILSSDVASVSTVTKEAIAELDPVWIKTVAKTETRWVFITVVEELIRQLGLSPWARARIRGYLFDTETGTLLWEDDGIATARMGYFFSALVDDMALEEAVIDLTKTFPNKPK